jgi:hypothetical protein
VSVAAGHDRFQTRAFLFGQGNPILHQNGACRGESVGAGQPLTWALAGREKNGPGDANAPGEKAQKQFSPRTVIFKKGWVLLTRSAPDELAITKGHHHLIAIMDLVYIRLHQDPRGAREIRKSLNSFGAHSITRDSHIWHEYCSRDAPSSSLSRQLAIG